MFYSHYEKDNSGTVVYQKELKLHLFEVAASTREIIGEMQHIISFQAGFPDLAYIIGITHDFGKYTQFFQNYLVNNVNAGHLKNHSLLSAIWGGWVIYHQEKWDKEIKLKFFLLTFGSILNHHGEIQNLSNWLLDLYNYFQPDLRDFIDTHRKQAFDAVFKKQLPDILSRSLLIDKELQNSQVNLPSISSLLSFTHSAPDACFYKFLYEAISHYDSWNANQVCGQFNQELYLLFSVLIDTDKRDAANVIKEIERQSIPENLASNYVANTKFTQTDKALIEIRKSIFNELNQAADRIDLNNKIYTLTAPTGAGKTLSVLNFAFKLRQRLYNSKQYLPRIIYALPFTTIIDQNYEIIANVLSQLPRYNNNQSAFLLKHHHLAEIAYKTEKDDSIPVDKALMLVESWEAEIIVTTFIQLLNTVIGNKNRFLKKYHKIFGSIIILDEIQNVPVEYWILLKKQLSMLAEWAQCYIILMSATQPLIFQPDESFELIPTPIKNFKKLNRTVFKIDLTPLKVIDFYESFSKDLKKTKSYAIIVNTIRTSIELFNLLSNNETVKHRIFYLSTNIIPETRAERIQAIFFYLKKKEPVILVCTQVIEAGVDLDFDVIYRDIAPVDSLIQSAGRANRHGNKDKGIVNIIRLVNEQDRTMANWVYGSGHLSVTEKLMDQLTEIQETDFYNLVQNNYYQLVKLVDQNIGIQIYNEWWLGSTFESLCKFNLITQHGFYRDVFISVDEKSEKIWNQYLELILKEYDINKRRKNHLLLKKSLRDYTLSVPEKLCKLFFWDYCRGNSSYLGYINNDCLDDYYDICTGLRRFNEQEPVIF